MEHMESLIQGHFLEEPDRAMTRAEWDVIAVDSAKEALDARKLHRLKKKEEDELRAKSAHHPGDAKLNASSSPRGCEQPCR